MEVSRGNGNVYLRTSHAMMMMMMIRMMFIVVFFSTQFKVRACEL